MPSLGTLLSWQTKSSGTGTRLPVWRFIVPTAHAQTVGGTCTKRCLYGGGGIARWHIIQQDNTLQTRLVNIICVTHIIIMYTCIGQIQISLMVINYIGRHCKDHQSQTCRNEEAFEAHRYGIQVLCKATIVLLLGNFLTRTLCLRDILYRAFKVIITFL